MHLKSDPGTIKKDNFREDAEDKAGPASQYALVTGASSGLGKAFALELAGRKINLLLVALPGDGLPGLCENLKTTCSIKCDFFETDMTQHESVYELVRRVKKNYRVNILINNLGMGGSHEFASAGTGYLENMISLNIRTLTLLTHQLLPELKSHKKSYILNVSSLASFSPIGYKTIYSASKVFVLYFSRGLSQELKDTGVFVSVVHPGPMRTNSHVVRRIESHGIFGKMGVLTPEYMAYKSIDMMFRRKPIIILGWFNRLCWLGMKLVPLSIRLPLISKQVKKTLPEHKQ